jgi:hypothetical protein
MLATALQKRSPWSTEPVPNPQPLVTAAWVIAALAAGGVLVYFLTRPRPAKAAATAATPTTGGLQVNCATKPATPDAPYGFAADGQGGCAPAPVPDEAVNCNERQIWDDGTKKCVTPPWNKIWPPPSEPVEVPLTEGGTFEFQLRPSDGIVLDQLGYDATESGVLNFQKDLNLVNAILIEQGPGAMGGILLNEDGTMRDEVRTSMGWALAYAEENGITWQQALDRVRSLPGI